MKKIDALNNKDIQSAMKLLNNKEFSKAHKKLLKLANAGSARAQYALGVIYYNGDGCHVDDISATHYFKLSAMQKFEPAMYWYAVALGFGYGTKQCVECARNLMRETAAMGYPDAIEFLSHKSYDLLKTLVNK